MTNVRVVASLTHSKGRNMYGLVIITCNVDKKKVRVRFAKEFPRERLNEIVDIVSQYYEKIKWDEFHIDQLTGQHIINSLKNKGIPVKTITTQKDLKDPEGIEDLEIMDKIEMVNLFLKFRQNKQIEFHPKPIDELETLEFQMTLYTEHKTEAGGIDYYPPGEEHDHLTKALLIAVFAVRNILENEFTLPVGGPISKNGRRRRPRFMGRPDYKRDTDIVAHFTRDL